MEKVETNKNTYIGLTKKDMDTYGELVYKNFSVELREISEKYIGGCIIESDEQGIFIDNTLLNSVDERLKG